MPDAAPL